MIINYSDQEVIKGKKSIFLAGPTPRGENVDSWRTEACKILEQIGFDGVVYVPEYSTWKPKADYVDQAMWERIALTNATVIWLYRLDYGKKPYEDLQSLLDASVNLVNNLYDEQVNEILPLRERKMIKKLRK